MAAEIEGPRSVWHPSRRRLGGFPTWAGGQQILPSWGLFPAEGGGWALAVWAPSPAEPGAYRCLQTVVPAGELAGWLLAWEADPEGCLRQLFGYCLPEWATREPGTKRMVPAGAIESVVSASSLGF